MHAFVEERSSYSSCTGLGDAFVDLAYGKVPKEPLGAHRWCTANMFCYVANGDVYGITGLFPSE